MLHNSHFYSMKGVFASQGNVKGNLLAKMIVNAVILCEQAGLWIDYICCDGASWNRSMWRCFGIKVGSHLQMLFCPCHVPDWDLFVRRHLLVSYYPLAFFL